MSFSIALSGISAANTDLNTISNNIANSNTDGFKESTAEFGDLFDSGTYSVEAADGGSGVTTEAISQDFSEGTINTTNDPLNMAINGNGFFTVSNNGTLEYTRNGDFTTNSAGYVVTSTGQELQVYPPLSGGTAFNTGTLTSLQLSTAPNPPVATTTIDAGINLPADATAPADSTFSPTDSNSYNETTAVTVYDSLGAAQTANLYFVAGSTPGNWTEYTVMNGSVVGSGNALTFGSSGTLTSPASGTVGLSYTPTDGASAIDATIDFSGTTQYGDTFSVNSLTQNGQATGQLSGVSISDAGVVSAQYSNGQDTVLGQVAMANFSNPQGLQQLGNATWAQTYASGAATPGAAGSSDFGTIQSGAIESSNVDLTTQLVDMMNAQRNYEANSQVISTQDQMLQTIMQLR